MSLELRQGVPTIQANLKVTRARPPFGGELSTTEWPSVRAEICLAHLGTVSPEYETGSVFL